MKTQVLEVSTLIPWIILGDDSKYVFVRWCLDNEDDISTEELKFNDVFLYHSSWSRVEREKNSVSIYSKRLLPGSFAHIPVSNDQYNFEKLTNRTILIFEGFPFGKDIIRALTDKCRNTKGQANAVLNVLMDLPNRRGSTDIQLDIDVIAEVEGEYAEDDYNVMRITNYNDVSQVFYWHEFATHHWKLQAHCELEKFKDRIAGFEFDYTDWVFDAMLDGDEDSAPHILSERRLYELCTFSTIDALQKSKSTSIEEAYWKVTESLIFESQDFEQLLFVFEEQCQCCVCPLDFSKVRKKVKNDLKEQLRLQISTLFENSGDKKRNNWTMELYHSMITDESNGLNGINARYIDEIKDFFGIGAGFASESNNPVVCYLKSFMQDYLMKMEELIG